MSSLYLESIGMSKQFEYLYKNYLGNTGNSVKVRPIYKFLFKHVETNGWFNKDYKVKEELPALKAGEQSVLMKEAIVNYFLEKELIF